MKRKKKYRLKWKRIIVTLFIIICIFLLCFNFNNITTYIKYKSLHYSNDTIKLLNNNDINIDKYSKTLDYIINTSYYEEDKLDYYLDIEYKEEDNFFDNINKLIDIGYNSNEINNILEKIDNINIILDNSYNKNILDIINSNYYKEDNLERYLNYDKNNIVLNVNMYLDYEFYTHDINIDKVDNLVIVNKYYKLDSNYIPELVNIDSKYAINNYQKLTSEAKDAFEKMCSDARDDNIYIYSGSSYRSYTYQDNLYKTRVYNEGIDYADSTAARAGYSEHQTGLALDIVNKNIEYLSEDDIEYEWLINNSYKYGFILRYPKDKEDITGYSYEPWHFRYINVEIATYLKNNNITYDEYIGMNL